MFAAKDKSIDIIGVCETWLTDSTNPITATIKSFGYDIIHNFRTDQRGGGTAIVYKSSYRLSMLSIARQFNTFEHTAVSLKTHTSVKVVIVVVYRTGPIALAFYNELDLLLSDVSAKCDYFIVAGDLNIHFETINNKLVKQCSNVFKSYGVQQQVFEATHINGGFLDQVFTYCDNGALTCTVSVDSLNHIGSDHFPVYCDFNIRLQEKTMKELRYRNIKSINKNLFTADILGIVDNLDLTNGFKSALGELQYDITKLLDHHAPFVTKLITIKHEAPWFDKEYRDLRSIRRKAESKMRKTKSIEDVLAHKTLCKDSSLMARSKKKEYFTNMITKSNGNPRTLYQLVNKELDRKQTQPLPDYIDDIGELASTFNSFFVDKIANIRKNITKEPLPSPSSTSCQFLDNFEPTSEEEIRGIIKESGVKCSPADLLPQSLFENHLDTLIPALVELVNLSLSTGDVEGIKLADIIPLIKGTSLDPNILKNFRPVSNLTFLGKLIERVVLNRLNDHLARNDLNINEQSAYKKNNSTETLLVRISNDILIASDNKDATVVMLLDLSAAFDTVDHSLLLRILKYEIGLRGTVLNWFRSFLTGRSQRTRLGSTVSDEVFIMFGVPQGSVLGPVLFNIYIRSIYSSVKHLGFDVMGYADDHQVYKHFQSCQQSMVLAHELSRCFKVIQNWMNQYYLQLNSSKTQIIVFGTPSIHIQGINLVDGTCIRFVSTVKNLGVYMDSCLSMEKQVMEVKKKSFRTLRNICKIRFLLSKAQLKVIVNSLVVSCLDYCNGLYFGINEKQLHQLQLIQNAAVKVVTGKYKHDHMDNDLSELHWLEVKKRVLFKIALLVYKSLNGLAPRYLQDLVQYAKHGHNVRLYVPPVCSKQGERAFSVIGPRLYNYLPTWVTEVDDIVCFKNNLKTFLFKLDMNKIISMNIN